MKQNVAIRAADIVLQLVLLVQCLENGCPLVLIYTLTAIIALNSIACAMVMCLKTFQSRLRQVLVDCL